MKLFRLIRTNRARRKLELERELEIQKRRFSQATRETADSIRYEFSPKAILSDYPVEAALAIMLGGITIGTLIQSHHRERRVRLPSGFTEDY